MRASSPPKAVRVFIGTANLGNARPDEASLSAWVPRDGVSDGILPSLSSPGAEPLFQPDNNDDDVESPRRHQFEIVVLGFQEATFEGPDAGTTVLHGLLEQHLPSYDHVVKFQRGEMRLEIFVHSEACHAKVLHVSAQNTGLAGLANKGGILAELLVLKNLRLSFTTCHLEAHEGATKYQIRCATIADILNGTKPPGEIHDTTMRNHYAFVLGDLNFRTELPADMIQNEEDHKRQVRELVDKQDWKQLNQYDELRRALKQKDCLAGFQTSDCHFPPTFKVERQKGFKYIDKRRPSYTDRILYKAGHELEDRIKLLLYEPIEDFATSDHKPVRGVFEIQPNVPISLQPRNKPARASIFQRLSFSPKALSSSVSSRKKEKDHCLVLHISQLKCELYKPDAFWNRLVLLKRLQMKKSALHGATSQETIKPALSDIVEDNAEASSDNLEAIVPSDSPADSSPQVTNPVTSVASPYIVFASNPEHCLERRHRSRWHDFINVVLSLGRERSGVTYYEGTRTRTAMDWPRTSIQQRTREPDWGKECVKLIVRTQLPNGEMIPLTGSMLHFTVMDGQGIRSHQGSVLLGTFSLNLANLIRQCMEAKARHAQENAHLPPNDQRQSMRKRAPLSWSLRDIGRDRSASAKSMGSREMSGSSLGRGHAKPRASFLGRFGLAETEHHQEDVVEVDIAEPLLKNGKEVGLLQCHITAGWSHGDSSPSTLNNV